MRKRTSSILGLAAITLFSAGCHTDLWVQPHLRAQTYSDFAGFSDHATSRPPVPGAVARGEAMDDTAYYTGRQNGKYLTDLPLKQALADYKKDGLKVHTFKEFLLRGQERFTIYCTPCHGGLGDGNGMIAQRGFAIRRQPASYHTDRLRKMPIGHFFDVMTNGYGTMFSYAARVQTDDRWAIASYIRVLQKSQDVPASKLPPGQAANLQTVPDDLEQTK
jgi:mono/diheme cytochrome c family protein